MNYVASPTTNCRCRFSLEILASAASPFLKLLIEHLMWRKGRAVNSTESTVRQAQPDMGSHLDALGSLRFKLNVKLNVHKLGVPYRGIFFFKVSRSFFISNMYYCFKSTSNFVTRSWIPPHIKRKRTEFFFLKKRWITKLEWDKGVQRRHHFGLYL